MFLELNFLPRAKSYTYKYKSLPFRKDFFNINKQGGKQVANAKILEAKQSVIDEIAKNLKKKVKYDIIRRKGD